MRADIASADPTLCRPPCSPAAISLCNKLPLAAITQPDLGDLVAKGLFDNDPEITDTTAAILQHISFLPGKRTLPAAITNCDIGKPAR